MPLRPQDTDYNTISERLVRWLVETNIYNDSDIHPYFGTFNLNYDFRKKSYAVAHSEITGYAVKLLVNLFNKENTRSFLTIAENSARAIIKMQNMTIDPVKGAFPFCYYLPGGPMSNKYYSFDTAICVTGLIDLYKETEKQEYFRSAEIAGEWLVQKTQNRDGSFRAVYDVSKGKFGTPYFWYGNGGCLHAKNAIPLLKLYEESGNTLFKKSAKKVCDWVLDLQNEDGSFKAKDTEHYVYTHAHCYATEGLLYSHFVLGDERYLDAAIGAAKWLSGVQCEDGGLLSDYITFGNLGKDIKGATPNSRRIWMLLYYLKHGILRAEVTDATAQSMRIWTILHHLKKEEEYLNCAKRGARFLRAMQCMKTGDPNTSFGLYHQRLNILKYEYFGSKMSAWSNMFSIQALHFLDYIKKKDGFYKAMTELF